MIVTGIGNSAKLAAQVPPSAALILGLVSGFRAVLETTYDQYKKTFQFTKKVNDEK
jgi:hypothetical protein